MVAVVDGGAWCMFVPVFGDGEAVLVDVLC